MLISCKKKVYPENIQ